MSLKAIHKGPLVIAFKISHNLIFSLCYIIIKDLFLKKKFFISIIVSVLQYCIIFTLYSNKKIIYYSYLFNLFINNCRSY